MKKFQKLLYSTSVIASTICGVSASTIAMAASAPTVTLGQPPSVWYNFKKSGTSGLSLENVQIKNSDGKITELNMVAPPGAGIDNITFDGAAAPLDTPIIFLGSSTDPVLSVTLTQDTKIGKMVPSKLSVPGVLDYDGSTKQITIGGVLYTKDLESNLGDAINQLNAAMLKSKSPLIDILTNINFTSPDLKEQILQLPALQANGFSIILPMELQVATLMKQILTSQASGGNAGGGSAGGYLDVLVALTRSNPANTTLLKEYLAKHTSHFDSTLVNEITDILDNVKQNLSHTSLAVNSAGVAAGDQSSKCSSRFTFFINPVANHTRQEETGDIKFYKSNMHGITLGGQIGDDHILGASYNFIDSTMSGLDSTTYSMHMGNIYGIYNFNEHIFIDGDVRYGLFSMKKQRQTNDTNQSIAFSNIKGSVYGGTIKVGYTHYFNNDKASFVPSIALAHNTLAIDSYNETGASALNRAIGDTKAHRTYMILGSSLSQEFQLRSLLCTPEGHIQIISDLNNNIKSGSITLPGLLNSTTSVNMNNKSTLYNLGLSLKFAHFKSFDLKFAYDLGLKNKYISHTGNVRVRLHF